MRKQCPCCAAFVHFLSQVKTWLGVLLLLTPHWAKNSNKQHSSKQMAVSSGFWKAESWNLDTLPPTVTESSTCQLKGSSWLRPSTLCGSLQPAWPTSVPTQHHSTNTAKLLVQSQMLLKMYTQTGAALCLLPRHQVPFLAKDNTSSLVSLQLAETAASSPAAADPRTSPHPHPKKMCVGGAGVLWSLSASLCPLLGITRGDCSSPGRGDSPPPPSCGSLPCFVPGAHHWRNPTPGDPS